MREQFERLGLCVLERGWLSSNNVVFAAGDAPSTVVDTGYASHSAQTVALVERTLAGAPLARVINTHLHSDHCGGNAALHARWRCEIVVPHASFDAARHWRTDMLTFESTGQHCDRFPVHASIAPGDLVMLGRMQWEVHAVGGHDPEALVLFQPDLRVLISGDALWRERVAIIFPELAGKPGFGAALDSLGLIESLRPRIVIPGHGAPFTEVADALERSRRRIDAFAREPMRHWQYATRALLMFHMLEHRRRRRADLVAWARQVSVMGIGIDSQWVEEALDRLLADDALKCEGEWIIAPGN